MRLYLDEDSGSGPLTGLLRKAGHDVQKNDAGLAGSSDAAQFTHACREGRAILAHNYTDFEELHYLIVQAGGHHPGVLVVRRDPGQRKMTPHDIVRAIRNLEAAGVPVADEYVILNAWR
jgi:hypothetical protein